MIAANELRIGNWVNHSADQVKIDVPLFIKIFRQPQYYKPIPLTPEWLLKIGFKKIHNNANYFISIPEVKGEIHFEKFRDSYVCILYCSTGSFIPNDIQSLHQLQNLYFALTGTELEIKL